MFDRLAGRTTDHTVSGTVPNADGLIPVNPSRFQVGDYEYLNCLNENCARFLEYFLVFHRF